MVIMIIAWMLTVEPDEIPAGYLFNISGEAKMPLIQLWNLLRMESASEISSELSDSFGFRFLWVSWWVTPRVNVWIAMAEYMCLYWFNL